VVLVFLPARQLDAFTKQDGEKAVGADGDRVQASERHMPDVAKRERPVVPRPLSDTLKFRRHGARIMLGSVFKGLPAAIGSMSLGATNFPIVSGSP
jgi:hypothetical protein